MPVRVLPSKPNLDHLKHQAKDLMKAHAARGLAAAQLLREFHPRFSGATDAAIFAAAVQAQRRAARHRARTRVPQLDPSQKAH